MSSMVVSVEPAVVGARQKQRCEVTVSVTNNSPLINGFTVRVFGLDPDWVVTTPDRLSLFPGDTGTFVLGITLPEGFPAGPREISVYVGSELDADDFEVAGIVLEVADKPKVRIGLDPQSLAAGKKAEFGLIVANLGNVAIEAVPRVIDPEDEATFTYEPERLSLRPGDQDVVRIGVSAKRPWIGQPKVRVLTFQVETPEPIEAMGSMVQRARIGRGLITVLGLIAAAAVFGAVLLKTLSGVVEQASLDGKIVEKALEGEGGAGATVSRNPGSISGSAVSGVDGAGLAGLTATLFGDDDGSPLATSATSDSGAFNFDKLGAGSYRILLSGAGFADSWYAGSTTFDDATVLELDEGEDCDLSVTPTCSDDGSGDGSGDGGTDGGTGTGSGSGSGAGGGAAGGGLALTGLPGSVSGRVLADDPTGATATLVVEGVAADDVDAVAATVDVSADGTFSLTDIPTPQRYTLKVDRNGSATALRTIDLGPGEQLEGLEITLDVGAGVITGTVTSAGFPVPGATIEVSDGTTSISTVSLTEGLVGAYTLRDLSVPGTYTLTVTAERFARASQVVTLTDDNPRPIVPLFLTPSVGRIAGQVVDSGGRPLGGVTVRVTGGDVDASSATVSVAGDRLGTFNVTDLPVPGAYTVTFSRPGFIDQVVLAALEPVGDRFNATGLNVALRRQAVTVQGTVVDVNGQPAARATVTLTNGTTTRTVRTADSPAGTYSFSNVAPGSYTVTASSEGTRTSLEIINATAGIETLQVDQIRLSQRASIAVTISFDPDSLTGDVSDTEIRLYRAADFPSADPGVAVERRVIGGSIPEDGSPITVEFGPIEAPEDYVLAIFSGASSTSEIATQFVSSIAAEQVAVQFPNVTLRRGTIRIDGGVGSDRTGTIGPR